MLQELAWSNEMKITNPDMETTSQQKESSHGDSGSADRAAAAAIASPLPKNTTGVLRGDHQARGCAGDHGGACHRVIAISEDCSLADHA